MMKMEDRCCDDCARYNPMTGECRARKILKHGYEDACGWFIQETDTSFDEPKEEEESPWEQMTLF